MEYTKKLLTFGLLILGIVSINQVNNITDVSNQIININKPVTDGNTIDLVKKVKEEKIITEAQEITNVVQEITSNQIVEVPLYHGLTKEQVIDKASRVLNGTLVGTGPIFVNYSIEKNVDPLLAIAIVLQETGCYYGACSSLVSNYYNVGGMMGNGGYLTFSSLDEGIVAYINNITNNFVSRGLITAEQMNPAYAADPLWAQRVNAYIDRIIAA